MSVDTLHRVAETKPLAHPGTASITLFDFDTTPPEHLRDIYGSVYRAMHPETYPNAPKKLGFILPREHGKSEAGSHVIPTWAALRDPNIRVLLMSETLGQAKNKLNECRNTINKLGPRFGRKIKTDNSRELTLERDANHDVATITAAGFDSGVTGGHFDVIVFDDLVSWKTQRTEARREKSKKQFQEHLNLKSGDNTVFLVLGTRKHPEDLYQFLIDSPAWHVRVEQAISDWSVVENREFDIVTNLGNRYDSLGDISPREETVTGIEPHRDVDVLWPDRHPLDALILDMLSATAEGVGSPVWRRENQNDARALMGQILDESMFQFTPIEELTRHATSSDGTPQESIKDRLVWYAGIDLAVEADAEKAAMNDTDYYAIAILGHDRIEDLTYLWDIHRRRGMTLSESVTWAKAILDDYDISTVLAESNQAQRWFVQTAEDAGLSVEETTSTGKKEDRILSMSTRIENGKVRLVEADELEEKWLSFASEWSEFPTGAHDDRLDATEIALRGLEEDETPYTLFAG